MPFCAPCWGVTGVVLTKLEGSPDVVLARRSMSRQEGIPPQLAGSDMTRKVSWLSVLERASSPAFGDARPGADDVLHGHVFEVHEAVFEALVGHIVDRGGDRMDPAGAA